MKKIFSSFIVFAFFMSLSFSCFATGKKNVSDFIDLPEFFDSIFIQAGDVPDKSIDPILVEKSEKSIGVSVAEKSEKKETDEKKSVVKNLDLVVILDRSGSMYGLENDTIGGFNSMVEEQRKLEIPVSVSLIMFNNKVTKLYEKKEIKDVEALLRAEYSASGTTALFDAVGETLSSMKEDPATFEEGRKNLVVITTDGYENASKEWTKEKVRKLIGELREKNFEFVFLGADIDAADVGKSIGIAEENSVKFKKTSTGVRSNFKAVGAMMNTIVSGDSLESNANWKNSIERDR